MTCGTADKKAFLLAAFPTLKEDHIGDSRSCSFEETVKRQTAGKGVHLALNSLADDKLQVCTLHLYSSISACHKISRTAAVIPTASAAICLMRSSQSTQSTVAAVDRRFEMLVFNGSPACILRSICLHALYCRLP